MVYFLYYEYKLMASVSFPPVNNFLEWLCCFFLVPATVYWLAHTAPLATWDESGWLMALMALFVCLAEPAEKGDKTGETTDAPVVVAKALMLTRPLGVSKWGAC